MSVTGIYVAFLFFPTLCYKLFSSGENFLRFILLAFIYSGLLPVVLFHGTQVYNTVLLIIVNMLHITSLGLIYFITGSLYLLIIFIVCFYFP